MHRKCVYDVVAPAAWKSSAVRAILQYQVKTIYKLYDDTMAITVCALIGYLNLVFVMSVSINIFPGYNLEYMSCGIVKWCAFLLKCASFCHA